MERRFDCTGGSTQRDDAGNKKRQRHSGLWGGVAVLRLAFKQMIDFVADGMQIIEAEIYNGIADVCYLVHFL